LPSGAGRRAWPPGSGEGLRFVDQHDGDVILDGVDELATVADQRFVGRRPVNEIALTLRADEDIEQVLGKWHQSKSPSGTGNPNRSSAARLRRHFGITFTQVSR